jgi:hypothetical protein
MSDQYKAGTNSRVKRFFQKRVASCCAQNGSRHIQASRVEVLDDYSEGRNYTGCVGIERSIKWALDTVVECRVYNVFDVTAFVQSPLACNNKMGQKP